MPQPTINDVTPVDPLLTNVSLAIIQSATRFIAASAAPRVRVGNQTGTVDIIDTENFYRDLMEKRSSGEESAGTGYTRSTDTFYTPVWALHKDIGRQERSNQIDPVQLEQETTTLLTHAALQRLENEFASACMTTGVWATDRTGATDFQQWNDDASDPIAEIDAQVEALDLTGAMGRRVLILGRSVFRHLRRHPLVESKYNVTNTESINEEMLARVFNVDEVRVMSAVTDPSNEGGTASKTFVVQNDALLMIRPEAPGLQTPSAAYTLTWDGLAPGIGSEVAMRRFDMQHLNSTRFEIEQAFQVKVMQTELAVFFSGATA